MSIYGIFERNRERTDIQEFCHNRKVRAMDTWYEEDGVKRIIYKIIGEETKINNI